MNRGDRSELKCTERATRGSSTPPAGPSRAGGEENPREATQGHPETAHLHPAHLKEGREKKERPGVHDFLRNHSRRKDIGAVEEEPEGRKRKVCASKKKKKKKSRQTLPP